MSATFPFGLDPVSVIALSFYYLTSSNSAANCTKVTTDPLWHLLLSLLSQFCSDAFFCKTWSYIWMQLPDIWGQEGLRTFFLNITRNTLNYVKYSISAISTTISSSIFEKPFILCPFITTSFSKFYSSSVCKCTVIWCKCHHHHQRWYPKSMFWRAAELKCLDLRYNRRFNIQLREAEHHPWGFFLGHFLSKFFHNSVI